MATPAPASMTTPAPAAYKAQGSPVDWTQGATNDAQTQAAAMQEAIKRIMARRAQQGQMAQPGAMPMPMPMGQPPQGTI